MVGVSCLSEERNDSASWDWAECKLAQRALARNAEPQLETLVCAGGSQQGKAGVGSSTEQGEVKSNRSIEKKKHELLQQT